MKNYTRLLAYMRPYVNKFVLAIVCIILASGANLYVPWIIKDMIDDVLADKKMALLNAICIGIVVIFFLRGIFYFGQSYLVGRLLVDVPRFSLPNILVGETFETELLQDAVQPERIAEAMERIIADGTERDYVTERLARAVALLGEPHAARRVAEKILALGKHA